MKLFRFREGNKVKPGVCIDEKHYDASAIATDFSEIFFQNEFDAFVSKVNSGLPEVDLKAEQFDSPVARPSKIVCIGLNYASHAKETGAAIPAEPVVFMKSTTALCGPFDDVMIPKDSVKTDWEVELAIVIGKKASYVDEAEAMDYVAGYCLHNDISEREFQLERGGTWDKGKGCDTFAPFGPYLVTKDEVTNPPNLRLWLSLNGKMMQDGNTSDFIFNITQVISYVSRFMTLLPGDIISTGTPHGVGLGLNPQVYLKPGDVMELGIDGLGISKQNVIAFNIK
ncbi:MAG: fumarylacetoacetate hydrolase family protein [Chitinophagaceae bacterium]|nr:fumarylacetoacetate hydrolase family protein [Chitinophagaceae bacterium]